MFRHIPSYSIISHHIPSYSTALAVSASGMAGVSGSHANVAFAKAKALLGTIGGVERARVSDLQNPTPDQALPPHWRVPGIKLFLLRLLDYMLGIYSLPVEIFGSFVD